MKTISFMTIVLAVTIIFSSCEKVDYTTGTRLKVSVYSDFNEETPVGGVTVDLYEKLHDQNDPNDTSKRIKSKTTNSSGYVIFTDLDEYAGGRLYLRLTNDYDSQGNITISDIIKDEMNEISWGGFSD